MGVRRKTSRPARPKVTLDTAGTDRVEDDAQRRVSAGDARGIDPLRNNVRAPSVVADTAATLRLTVEW